MKRFELQIGLYVDAENFEAMWDKVRESGLHDLLNKLDAEGHYESEIVGETETPVE